MNQVMDGAANLGAVRDENATRILDAARACFAAGGVRRTTMNQVAELAGVGVATAYRRFPRKAQLVQAVLLREADTVIGEVGAAMHAPDSAAEQSAAGFTAFAHAVKDRPLLVRLMRDNDGDGSVPGLGGELLDQIMAMARDYIAAWVRGHQAQGRFPTVEADVVAEIEARLALSLVLAPDGMIPIDDDAATRAFALTYLVPMLGPEGAVASRAR